MGAEGDTNSLDQSFTKLNDVWNIVKDNKDEIYSKIIYGYDGKGGIWNFKLNVKIYDSIDKMIEVQNKYMTEKYNNLKTKETEIINKYKKEDDDRIVDITEKQKDLQAKKQWNKINFEELIEFSTLKFNQIEKNKKNDLRRLNIELAIEYLRSPAIQKKQPVST